MNRTGLAGCAACVAATLAASPSLAKVPEAQAAELGRSLTPFGAEKAGNADGSIPAYTGGLTAPPAGIEANASTPLLPDPYPNDQVLYTVSASNLSQYAALVTPGVAAILRKYPKFHLNVYQTRRSAGYPQFVLDNAMRNARTAELTGDIEGDGVKGAYGGPPFPIPQNGYEVLWNNYLAWNGVAHTDYNGGGYLVDSNGNVSLDGISTTTSTFPYYDPTSSKLQGGFYWRLLAADSAPAAVDGEKFQINYPINYSEQDQLTYFYSVGERRVRLAPQFKYDTPIAANGGAFTYDEINLYAGRPDRYEFKLIGKREMLIPYNNFKVNQRTPGLRQFLTPDFPNPEQIRWEKHRVWVTDAVLKPGKRNIYQRRTFYSDEDTWAFVASEAYDHGGALYRVGLSLPFPVYNVQYPTTFFSNDLFFNLDRGSYAVGDYFGGSNNGHFKYSSTEYPASTYSPDVMASSGLR